MIFLLHDFRERLIASDSAQRVFDHLLTACTARGLIKQRGTQRTVSTRVLAAVRDLTHLECVLEAIHWLLNQCATHDPSWVQAHIPPEWFTRYSLRADLARFPKAAAARERFALTIAADGYALMTMLAHPTTPAALHGLPSLTALRLIWIQQFYCCTIPGHETIALRTVPNKPLTAQIIQSPYDLEVRWCQRGGHQWIGYKVHLTETCDPGYPDLITHVATVPATEHDSIAAPRILADLAQRTLLPTTQLIDGGDMNTHVLLTGQQYGVDMLGPTVASRQRQHTQGTGYALEQFQIDWERQVVTCPQGHPSRAWRVVETDGQSSIAVRFDGPTCRACPVRAACTSRKRTARSLGFATQPVYTAMQAARERQTTTAFKAAYALRSGVERTIAQHVHRFDGRTSRYRGLQRTHLQQVFIALATNLVRVIAWLGNEPLDEERRPPGAFARYAPHRLSRRTMLV